MEAMAKIPRGTSSITHHQLSSMPLISNGPATVIKPSERILPQYQKASIPQVEKQKDDHPEYECADLSCLYTINKGKQALTLLECPRCHGRIFVKRRPVQVVTYSAN